MRRQLRTYAVLVRPPPDATPPPELEPQVWRLGELRRFRNRARAVEFLRGFPLSDRGLLGYTAEPERWPLERVR